jgi:serine/threonine protein kinase
VTRLIGIGTTGSVYLAREPALRRLVAVKVLDAELALNLTARARFEREAQAAARIVHPSVATVHQIGVTSDGRPYLVMPYVKGGTLADRMRSHGALPAQDVRPILAAAASALAAAHAVGVVHRDVRPANILYDERTGSVYLSDFGIAGVLESGDEELAKLTRSGELLGNAEYVSPEQSLGSEVDDRSDVYSLGILGRALLAGSTSATVTLVDSSDPELVELLERATSKEPRHRPNAAELAEALARPPGPASARGRGFFGEVLRRRMLPYVGAYLAAGIAGMGGIDQLVQQGLLAPVSYRLALAFFVAGLAAALVVAWYHGAKGRQSVPQVERAILALIALGWLVASVVILV